MDLISNMFSLSNQCGQIVGFGYVIQFQFQNYYIYKTFIQKKTTESSTQT